MLLLLNQTWVRSPVCSKASLLTPGCGERKCSVYCRHQARSPGQLVLRTLKLPDGFQESIFKGKVREGSPRVSHQLVHNSLIG